MGAWNGERLWHLAESNTAAWLLPPLAHIGHGPAGLIKSETAAELELNSPEDGLLKLKKADIAERRRGLSAMPEELVTILTHRELRDLIEFLASEK